MSTTKIWPSQGVINVTPTSYPIPQAGDVNWASLTDFLVALANGAQSTTFQRFANRTAITSPVTVSPNDCIVCTNLAAAGPVAVNLPAGVDKQVVIISDNKGDGQTNAITISPNGSETIGGQASLVLNTNNEAVILAFQASTLNWNIVAKGVPNPSGSSVGGFPPGMGIVSDGSGNLTASVTSAAELAFVDGVTSPIQTQLNNKQPLDGDLTAIAALAAQGFATRVGLDSWDTRTITAGSSKVSVVDGDGVAGNPVIDAVEANFTLDNIGGTLSVSKGGTGVTSVTTTPTALGFAGWDANQNLSANAFIPNYTTTATSGGTTTLSVGSSQLQYFTGTSAHTITLPVTSTLVLGQSFHIVNKSTQNITVQSSGANTVQVMAPASNATFTCILTSGTTAASWQVEYATAAAGTVTSVDVSGGTTGLTTSGGPVTTSGTITLAGTLAVANGGTGLTSGTSGGVPTYTASGTLTSSAALTNNQVIVGGGAGAVVKTLAAGTQGQILQMNATPIPAWTSISKPTFQRFTNPIYSFTITSATATAGSTYTNNGHAFQLTASITSSTTAVLISLTGGAPTASGTLTSAITAGTNLTFSAQSLVSGATSGVYTPSAGTTWFEVEMVGGGGGGSGGGSGGGGNGGNGGSTTLTGTSGTTALTCTGGTGGQYNSGLSFFGGTGTIVGAIGMNFQGGTTSESLSGVSANGASMAGAASPFGGAGGSVFANAIGNSAMANTGSGASGGGVSGASGIWGAGGAAGGYIRAMVTTVVASYNYTIGAGGVLGLAGTSGANGGYGASASINIIEHYI